MKTNRILSIMLILTFVFSLNIFVYADDDMGAFKDVDSAYSWAREAIEYMARQGIVNGVGNGNFSPKENITREQFAKILVLTFNEDIAGTNGEETFADVASNRWSYPYIEAVKYYLTGYYPLKGKPMFDPTGDATREDIAVALVKMMGYSAEDLINANILDETFTDADNVSPNLRQLVSIAVERKLMKGSNGMLRPLEPISRAETSVLLYRSMKASVNDASKELKLEVEVPEYVSSNNVFITGKTEAGAKVDINGEKVDVDRNGRFKEQFLLDSEGIYTYTITAQLGNNKASVQKTAVYQISAPEILVNELLESTNTSPVTVSGWVWDYADKLPTVYVNGYQVEVQQDGSWSLDLELVEGENTITIEAVNKFGKNVAVTKTVTFAPDAPVIDINELPEKTDQSSVTVSGAVYDMNDTNPGVYINDSEISVGALGVWSTTIDLTEGENVISIKAVNKLGKVTESTRTIYYQPDTPALQIITFPETTNSNLITISGVVYDNNDDRARVYVNDSEIYVNSDGSWSATVKLKDGENIVKVEATNKLGKTTTIEKKVIMFK